VNPRTGIALGVLGLMLYGVIMMFRGGDPHERYEKRQAMAKQHYEEEKKQKYEADSAYLLYIYTTHKGRTHSVIRKDVAKVLQMVLLNRLEPDKINRRYNNYREQGDLGTIKVHLNIDEQMYRGRGSQSFKGDSVPHRIAVEMEVKSQYGDSLLEGSRTATAKTGSP